MCCVVFVYILVCVLCCVCKYFSLCFFVKNKKNKKNKKKLHYEIKHTHYVRMHTRACIRTHLHLFEHRATSHTHTSARMRLNVLCTFERKHRTAFELTCVCSSAEPTSHTHLAQMRSNACTYIQSHAI
jgi:hypothetical protein